MIMAANLLVCPTPLSENRATPITANRARPVSLWADSGPARTPKPASCAAGNWANSAQLPLRL